MDLHAAIDGEWQVGPLGPIAVIPTGICIQVPEGFEAQVRSRSGLAAKHGVFVLNSPGTIDQDYRGEIKVILGWAAGGAPLTIRRGDRIAQLVVSPVARFLTVVVDELSPTERGEGGFGSTGISARPETA